MKLVSRALAVLVAVAAMVATVGTAGAAPLQPQGAFTMPRKRTGSVFPHEDHFDVQITLPDGTRSNRMCQPPEMSEAKARDKAKFLTEKAAKEGGAKTAPRKPRKGAAVPAGETFEAYAERWCAAREARGLASVDTDRGRLRKWVIPLLGATPIAAVAAGDEEGAEVARGALVKLGAGQGGGR